MRTLLVNGEAAAPAFVPDAAPPTSIDLNFLRPPQIIGEKSGRIYFLAAHEVEYLASAGNYVVAHVGVDEFLARATMKRIQARFAPLGFVQIERSLLVNLRRVAHVERHERGKFCFVMRSGARLVSSRERSSEIRKLLFDASNNHA